jgi:predicted peroxiredoxin
MNVLSIILSGRSDPTRASVPLHLAANGSLEVGDEPVIVFAGDGTEYLAGDAIEQTQGVGVPPMRDLVEKLRTHGVAFYI